MTSPRNTAADSAIEKFMYASEPGGIEAQEAQGQREVLNSTTLPTAINGAKQQDFEDLGFVFGDVIPDDPMFRDATLPEGWSREGSEHAMWSYLVDERGIKRVGVFYKAAFYDRSAHMHIVNVGWDIAQHYVYGDDTEFVLPAQLTEEEIAAVAKAAEDYLTSAELHPTIYGDRAPRARAVIESLT